MGWAAPRYSPPLLAGELYPTPTSSAPLPANAPRKLAHPSYSLFVATESTLPQVSQTSHANSVSCSAIKRVSRAALRTPEYARQSLPQGPKYPHLAAPAE